MLKELLSLLQPNEADAAMIPDVRKAYNAARKALRDAGKSDKPLYHSSRDVEGLVTNPRVNSAGNEVWKPAGIYAADNLSSQAKLMYGDYGTLRTSVDDLKRVTGFHPETRDSNLARELRKAYRKDGAQADNIGNVRVVPKPEARIRDIDEEELVGLHVDVDDQSLSPEQVAALRDSKLGDSDILRILNADGEPGLSEYLIRNPKAVNIFSDKKAWMPALAASVLGVGASADEAQAGPRAQAIREALKGTLYHGAKDPKGLLETGQLQTMAEKTGKPWHNNAAYVSDNPDYAKQYTVRKSLQDVIATEFDPTTRVKVLKDNLAGDRDSTMYVSDREAAKLRAQGYDAATIMPRRASKYDLSPTFGHAEIAVVNPEKVRIKNLDKELEKFILGVGAGGLAYAGSTQDADAFPLGKLKAESLIDTIQSTALPRSETALDRALGKKLNLHFGDGDVRKPYEIVDVRRGKDDQRFVIVKDENGQRHQLPMTSDYLNSMLGSLGTEDYLQTFKNQGLQGKKIQSLKSLGIREAKKANGSIQNDNLFRDWNAMQAAKAKEIDPSLVRDYVYVKNQQNETLYMPRAYADFLASKGHVKLLKR